MPKAEHYLYSVGWFEADKTFVARVAEFPSLAAHGDTQEELMRKIKSVVEFVVNDLKESGESLPEPFGRRSFSGKLVLRMPEYMHRQLTIEAMQQGISLNQLLNLKLEASR
ncbi:MAG: toxin-antitoxin system HicB family antitoxin [Actinomycetota bacterium]